jgi:phenylacetate-CoA ligase
MQKSLLHKIYHKYIKKDDLYTLAEFYEKSQYWSFEKLEQYQFEKLKELLIYSKKFVPYYSKLFEELGIFPENFTQLSDIEKIPFLTKDIIREHQNDLKSSIYTDEQVTKNATSGSTGSNLYFLSDKLQRNGQALVMRADKWITGAYFSSELKIWGAAWDLKYSKKAIPKIKNYFKKSISVSGYKLSDSDFIEYHKLMLSRKPEMITSYPSILYSLANFFEKNNLQYFPKAIKSAGEKLHEYQKEKIGKIFKCKILDFYGGRDIPMVAQSCGSGKGLHIMMESVILEVVDNQGNVLSEGEGELVLTHLNNRAMPFIRYKIGDSARISNEVCSCGRGLKLIDEILGRTFEIIEFPNGNRVGGTFWTFVMKSVSGIKDFQVVQTSPENFIINYVVEVPGFEINTQKLIKNITEFGGNDISIEFREVDKISVTKGGKLQFIIKQF